MSTKYSDTLFDLKQKTRTAEWERVRCSGCPATALTTRTKESTAWLPYLPAGWCACGTTTDGKPALWCGQCGFERKYEGHVTCH